MEADAVIARVGRAESELAGVRAFGVHDAVVIVKNFLDGNGNA